MKPKERPTATGGRTRWNMLMTEEEVAFLKEQARREGRTASDLVRSAIERLYRPSERLEPLRALDELRNDYLDRPACLRVLSQITGASPGEPRSAEGRL